MEMPEDRLYLSSSAFIIPFSLNSDTVNKDFKVKVVTNVSESSILIQKKYISVSIGLLVKLQSDP